MEKRITVEVPVKSSGNIIHNKNVDFDVFTEDDHFKAVPHLGEDDRRIANLPTELHFKLVNGKGMSLRGIKDGNQHVIEAIGSLLQEH